jgi:hypothetical protein
MVIAFVVPVASAKYRSHGENHGNFRHSQVAALGCRSGVSDRAFELRGSARAADLDLVALDLRLEPAVTDEIGLTELHHVEFRHMVAPMKAAVRVIGACVKCHAD